MPKRSSFHKTTQKEIRTISPLVVLISLFLSVACSKEKQETVIVAFEAEHSYTMKSVDVSTLVSDSGITRYRAKAKEWLVFGKAEEPYWFFPEGIYLEQFDTLFQVKASIQADTAYYYEKQELWKGIGHVEIQNLEGENFTTSLIYWDQKAQRIYSDRYIRIEQQDKVITGVGFESNQDFTKYKIFDTTGIFPVSETPPDSTQSSESSIDQ